MAAALRDDTSPLDADLENVIPGLQQWHRVNQEAMTDLTEEVQELKKLLVSAMETLKQARDNDQR